MPRRSEPIEGDSVYFIGTATTLIRLGPFTFLTDPNFLHRGQWVHIGHGLVGRRRTEPAAQPADLPRPDAVLLSHLHGDHFDRVAGRELARDLPIFTTGHAARVLGKRGFGEAVPMRTWDSHTLDAQGATVTVTAVPAHHATGLLGRLLPPVNGTVLRYQPAAGGPASTVYISGDTITHPDLRRVRERFPDLDLAIVHLGGTRLLGRLVTMDHRQGVDLLSLLRPRNAMPVHYDDYGLFASPLSNFVAEAEERAVELEGTRIHLRYRGQSLALERRPTGR